MARGRSNPATTPVNEWQNNSNTNQNQNVHEENQFAPIVDEQFQNLAPPNLSPAYTVHASEHPGMVLVSQPLTGSNFVAWQKSMRIALGAKSKLGFIDGSLIAPPKTSSEFIFWKKADYLVVYWLFSSVSKELYNTFVHAKSAKILWEDICERHGSANGTKFFHLQKRINNLKQGHVSISIFYGRLKEIWDELDEFDQIVGCTYTNCTCDIDNQLHEKETRTRLTQFLMGLNDEYENTANQLLMMDPLPSINKAYSVVIRVEQQRSLCSSPSGDVVQTSQAAMYSRFGNSNRRFGHKSSGSSFDRGKDVVFRTKEEKDLLVCSHCGEKRQDVSMCFKLHGYTEWFTKKKDTRRAVAHCSTDDHHIDQIPGGTL